MRHRLAKAAFSIFIVIHVFGSLVWPNPDSVIFKSLASFYVPYGNLFTFNTTWRFFSPNPLMRLVEYDVFTRAENEDYKMTTHTFPEDRQQEPFRDLYLRKATSALFLIMREDLLQNQFGRLLCKMHPGAETIEVRTKGRVVPTAERSQFEAPALADLGTIERRPVGEVTCETTK